MQKIIEKKFIEIKEIKNILKDKSILYNIAKMETYKKIQGFENYSVSDFGNVRNDKFGKCIKGRDDGYGYIRVCLINNKKKHDKSIHRLVAITF